jgi:hypothetical protein
MQKGIILGYRNRSNAGMDRSNAGMDRSNAGMDTVTLN